MKWLTALRMDSEHENLDKKECTVAGFHFASNMVRPGQRKRLAPDAKPSQTREQYETIHLERSNPKNVSPLKRFSLSPGQYLKPSVAKMLKEVSDNKRAEVAGSQAKSSRLQQKNEDLERKLEAMKKENDQLRESNARVRPRRTFSDLEDMHNDDVLQFHGIRGGKAALEGLYNVINSDNAAEDLNYWRGSEETKPEQENEEVDHSEEAGPRADGGDPLGNKALDSITQLLFVLFVLRTGVMLRHAAFDFGVSLATASRYFTTWISFLYMRLPKIFPRLSSEEIQKTTPLKFKKKYPGLDIKDVIDGTEIFMETPTDLNAQYFTFSDYKHHNTVKYLVGISPAGFLTFVSPAYPGRISDNDLVEACGYLNTLEPGDYVMADKGFLIRALLNKKQCDLIIPPKKRKRTKFNFTDTLNTRTVANLRIHVERMMQLVKQFKILHRTVPISMVDQMTKIFGVCCYLTFQWKPLTGVDFHDDDDA
jgi:hypothetical protein